MADIKTKDNAKGTIRTIDKAAVATQRMKQAYIANKRKGGAVGKCQQQFCRGIRFR